MSKLTFALFLLSLQNVYSIKSRIVGGENASSGQFAFSAAIYVQSPSSSIFCGGALISNQWILTAGHCVYGATSFTIRLGSNSLSSDDPNRVNLASSHYIVHPDFNPLSFENNVGLIQLRLPITFTSYIQPIQLATQDVPSYSHLTAIGWGQVNDYLADHLQYVSLITISNEECMNVYGFQVSRDMVCAAGNFNEGTCLGDVGSPLIQHIFNPQGVRHAGISTFISGDGCDVPHPSGYTRTYQFVDWINSVISE